MKTSKKIQSPLEAQLTFHYKMYQGVLQIKKAKEATKLFLQFAESRMSFDGWYVVFLDAKKRFKCWYNLENFIDIDAISADIIGFATLIKSKMVIMARIDDGKNSSICNLDILWISALLNNTKQSKVKLFDYLVITKNKFSSFRDNVFLE